MYSIAKGTWPKDVYSGKVLKTNQKAVYWSYKSIKNVKVAKKSVAEAKVVTGKYKGKKVYTLILTGKKKGTTAISFKADGKTCKTTLHVLNKVPVKTLVLTGNNYSKENGWGGSYKAKDLTKALQSNPVVTLSYAKYKSTAKVTKTFYVAPSDMEFYTENPISAAEKGWAWGDAYYYEKSLASGWRLYWGEANFTPKKGSYVLIPMYNTSNLSSGVGIDELEAADCDLVNVK